MWSPCRCQQQQQQIKVTQFLLFIACLPRLCWRFVLVPLLICFLFFISIAFLRRRLTYLAKLLFPRTIEWNEKRESSTCRCLARLTEKEGERKLSRLSSLPLLVSFLPGKGFFQTISNRPVASSLLCITSKHHIHFGFFVTFTFFLLWPVHLQAVPFLFYFWLIPILYL